MVETPEHLPHECAPPRELSTCDGVVSILARNRLTLHGGPRVPKDRSDLFSLDRTAETAQVVCVDLARARVAIDHGPAGVEGDSCQVVRRHGERIADWVARGQRADVLRDDEGGDRCKPVVMIAIGIGIAIAIGGNQADSGFR